MRKSSFLFLTALLASSALAACSRRAADPGTHRSAVGVGWSLDLPGERLRRGRVQTQPPGREEALISGLATATQGWGKACASAIDAALASNPSVPGTAPGTITGTLAIHLDATGALTNAVASGSAASPIDSCLISQALLARGQKLREGAAAAPLQAWVALDFSRATP